MSRTSPSAAAVLGPYLDVQLTAIHRLDPLVREGDADAIHDMRVAVRRLKAVLVAYRSTFEPATRRHLADELDWLAESLGHARDHDVQRLILRELASSEDDVAAVAAADRVMAANAHAALAATLTSARYRVLSEQLQALGSQPPWTAEAQSPARTVLARSLAKQFARMESRVDAAEKASRPAQVDERLHRVRKSVKRARYATEAYSPILTKEAPKLAHELAAIQDALGDHNDLVVMRDHSQAWADLGVSAINSETLKRLTTRVKQSRKEARRALGSARQIAEAGQALPR